MKWLLQCRRALACGLDSPLRFSAPCQLQQSSLIWEMRGCYSTKASKKGKVAPLQERRMIDRVRIWAKGGDGGNGCWSIRRSRSDWHGKADGGNGGKGGDVVLECSSVVWDFSNLQHHLNAKRGGHGSTKKKIGSRGSDKVVQVPIGTVVHLVSGDISFTESSAFSPLQPWDIIETDSDDHLTEDGNIADSTQSLQAKNLSVNLVDAHFPAQIPTMATQIEKRGDPPKEENSINKIDVNESSSSEDALGEDPQNEDAMQYAVAELTEPSQRLIIARGGEGGLGNAYIGKVADPRNKAKRVETISKREIMDGESYENAQSSLTAGNPGTESILILELKSIADVGLVGMPNAGKSTLLGAISRAKPAVGDYAFTTLRPNIGKLNYNDFFSVSVADIPGIIKGAHENRGLGHAFLRHIERTKVLAYVVDLAATLDGRKGIPPWEQLRDLVVELEHYQENLSNRPSLVVANKIDEDGTADVLEEFKRRVTGVDIFPVCAILEEGIPELKAGIRGLMNGGGCSCLTLDNIVVDLSS